MLQVQTEPYRPAQAGVSARYHRPGRRVDTRERRRQERQLAEALTEGRLRLSHAPRIDLCDATPLADEATLHWAMGLRSATPAAAAMTMGADPALGRALTTWLLHTGCAAAEPGTGRLVSLPLPCSMQHDEALVDMVDAALAETGLPAERLELRLTEAVLLRPSTESLLCLSALRDRGVGLAVDDFGMHIGSLAMLRHVPLTAIRLDPSLTHDLAPGTEDAVLCAALSGVAHALDMCVVARAADSSAQRALLCRAGIDAVA